MTNSFQESISSSIKSGLEELAKDISMIIENGSEEEQRRLFSLLQSHRVLKFVEIWQKRERRRDLRYPCSIPVTCATEDRVFEDLIKDISAGGAFLETTETFSPGQLITMTFSSADMKQPLTITGEVMWRTSEGIGVRFKTESKDLEAMISSL